MDCFLAGLRAEMVELHRADLRAVAVGFESRFGREPTYLRLKLCSWMTTSSGAAGGFLLHTMSTVVAMSDSVGRVPLTSWDRIPALPWV
jgi:hypothetical protein